MYLLCLGYRSELCSHFGASYYVSFEQMTFVSIVNAEQNENVPALVEEGYRAVTEGVPRHFQAALTDPERGAEARAELKEDLCFHPVHALSNPINHSAAALCCVAVGPLQLQ